MDPDLGKKPTFSLDDGSGVYGVVLVMVYRVVMMVSRVLAFSRRE